MSPPNVHPPGYWLPHSLLNALKKHAYIKTIMLTIFYMAAISHVGYSQSTITGQVTSQSEDTPAFANVLLLQNSDSTLIKGAVSDEAGLFSIPKIKAGDYLISVSIVGFETNYTNTFQIDGTSDFNIGAIEMQENAEVMKEVVIAAISPLYEQKMDRMVINVHNSITSAGGNALEVLAQSPGVEVNEINNVISIDGKQGVRVMMNGKINRLPMATIMDMLRGVDANNIDKIELYHTPPAHLDAEGDGGIINIIMKRNKDYGTNGSYSMNVGYGRRLKYGASVDLNYRNEKLNLYGNYGFRHRFSNPIYLFERTVQQMDEWVTTDSENNREGETIRNSIQIGLDYNLSKKTILGFLASAYYNDNEETSDNVSKFTMMDRPRSSIKNFNQDASKQNYRMFNVNLMHNFNQDERISFDVDYLHYDKDNPSSYKNNFFDASGNSTGTSEVSISNNSPIDNLSAQIDYANRFNENIVFQFGVKGTGSRFDNLILVNDLVGNTFVKNEMFSQDYELKEDIIAAYTSLNYELDEKTKMSFGLRYEYTDYLLSTQDNPSFLDQGYGYFFPSFSFIKTINDYNKLQFSFSRRISRPAFNELAPFVTFIDPNTFFKGNPELQPGISNNAKASYRFKTVLFSLSYSYSQDPIVTYQPVLDPATNTQIYTTLNLDEEHASSFNISIPYQPVKWWDIQSNFSANLERIILHKEAKNINLDTKSFSAYVVNRFKLPADFSLEITGSFKSPAYYGLLEVRARGAVNVGLQKKVGNGTFRLNCSDIFQTNIWRSITEVPELNLDNTLEVGIETRVIRLSYSAPFGSSTVKGKRRRKTSSSDQQRRI